MQCKLINIKIVKINSIGRWSDWKEWLNYSTLLNRTRSVWTFQSSQKYDNLPGFTGNCRLLGPTTARECHKRLCVTTVKTFGSGCAQGHCLSKIILFDFFLLNLIFYKVSFLNFFYRFIRFHWDLPKEGKICRVRVQIVRFAWEFKICHVTVFMTNKLITFFFCRNSRLISSN